MKHNSLRSIIILLLFTIFLTACNQESQYRCDLEISVIEQTLTPLLAHPETLITYDSDQIRFFLGLPERYCADCVVMVQSREGCVDEYGVFLCNNSNDADELEGLLNDYLELTIPGKLAYLNDSYADDFENQFEPSTVDSSENSANISLTGRVRRYGSYVCYTLLSEADDRALQNKLKALLSE